MHQLQQLEVRNIEDARKLVVSGLQEERSALGLDKPINNTQVNIGIVKNGAKTTLDKILEYATYVELLEMIAEIKKEKARRALNVAVHGFHT